MDANEDKAREADEGRDRNKQGEEGGGNRGRKERTQEVNIVKQCLFTHPDGTQETFKPGRYELPESVANHWFVQHHTDDPPEVIPPPGTPEAAQREQAKLRRKQLLEAAEEQQADEAGKAVRQRTRSRRREQDDEQPLQRRPLLDERAAKQLDEGEASQEEQHAAH